MNPLRVIATCWLASSLLACTCQGTGSLPGDGSAGGPNGGQGGAGGGAGLLPDGGVIASFVIEPATAELVVRQRNQMVTQQFAALDGRTAQALAAVAAQLAKQVLRTELEQRPEVVAAVASEAVNAVMLSARHISVFVHPADLPLVAEGAEEALSARGGRLLPDATLARGDVRVTSDVGSVDATVATRWAQAVKALGVDPARPEAEAQTTR